jgi:hypothetical protein
MQFLEPGYTNVISSPWTLGIRRHRPKSTRIPVCILGDGSGATTVLRVEHRTVGPLIILIFSGKKL